MPLSRAGSCITGLPDRVPASNAVVVGVPQRMRDDNRRKKQQGL